MIIMEFTLRTVVIMILLLVAMLVFASLILGWGKDSNDIMNAAINPFRDLFK